MATSWGVQLIIIMFLLFSAGLIGPAFVLCGRNRMFPALNYGWEILCVGIRPLMCRLPTNQKLTGHAGP